MVRRVFLLLFVTLALGLAGPAAARAAQQASPAPGHSGPVCGVTPQAVDELVARAFPEGTPAALSVAAIASLAESDLPQGTLADAALAAAADQVVQTWVLCYAAGEGARLFALMSDKLDASFLQQFISIPTSDTPEELRRVLESGLTGPLVLGSTSALAPPGRDIRVLADGRIGGIWTIGGDDAFLILVQEEGAWLVDEIIDIAA